jgi:hypothetical protein
MLFALQPVEAQELEWAKQAGGSGWGIAVDGSGDSYVTGQFRGSATFGAGETNETILICCGDYSTYDIFVAKYNSSGDLLWAKQAGGSDGSDWGSGHGIAVDGSGDSYVTGYFVGSATFGAGEANETTLNSSGDIDTDDIFVAKYNSSGDLLWAKQAGGSYFSWGYGIAVDGSGDSYVTGDFLGSATFGAGETNETILNSSGNSLDNVDIFVAKYNSSGDLLWAKKAGGSGQDRGYGIAVDGSGDSYVTGDFLGSATFGAGEANETTLNSSGSGDIFVARFSGTVDGLVEVLIDIKPGSYPNSINPHIKGKIPVAILSSMDFDAPAEVDTESLTFGPTGYEESLAFCGPSPEDVNDDGYDDLVCFFYTQMTGFACGDEEGILKGQTVDETPVEGSDSVRIVPSACR